MTIYIKNQTAYTGVEKLDILNRYIILNLTRPEDIKKSIKIPIKNIVRITKEDDYGNGK